MRRIPLVLLLGVIALPAASQQKPKFEVASIKPNRSGSQYSTSNGFQACRYVANNVPLKMMVNFAYRLPNGQTLPYNRILGGPSWMETDHYDVEAKRSSDADSISLDQFLLMVQALLEERFQLRTHWIKRDLPVYDLVVAKDGHKLKRSENQMQLPPPARNPILRCSGTPVGPPTLQVPSTSSRRGTEPGGRITVAYDPLVVSLTSTGVTVSALIGILQGYMDRPIINKTGLGGVYEFKLHFSRERLGVTSVVVSPPLTGQAALPPATDPSGPSIFTAVQGLGLKLESSKAPLDVLIIDSVQKPSEN